MYFKHKVTGGVYEFRGLCIIEETWEPGVLYHEFGNEINLIVLPANKFFDERFSIISEDEIYGITRDDDGVITDEGLENIFADDNETSSEDSFRHVLTTHGMDEGLIESILDDLKKKKGEPE